MGQCNYVIICFLASVVEVRCCLDTVTSLFLFTVYFCPVTLLRFILSFVSLTLYSLPIVVFDASLFTLCSALQFTYPLWLSSSTWPFATLCDVLPFTLPFVTCHRSLTLCDVLPFTLPFEMHYRSPYPFWCVTIYLTFVTYHRSPYLLWCVTIYLTIWDVSSLRYRLGRVTVHLTFCDMSPFTFPFVAWYRSRLTLCDVSPFTLPFVTCHRSIYPLWHDTILDALPFVTCHRSPDVSPFTSPFVACHRLPERLWRVAVYQVRSRLVPFHCLEWRAGSIMRKCIKWTALLPVYIYIYLHFRSMEVFGMGEQVNSCLSNTATRTKEHCEEHFACTQPPLSCLCICF